MGKNEKDNEWKKSCTISGLVSLKYAVEAVFYFPVFFDLILLGEEDPESLTTAFFALFVEKNTILTIWLFIDCSIKFLSKGKTNYGLSRRH